MFKGASVSKTAILLKGHATVHFSVYPAAGRIEVLFTFKLSKKLARHRPNTLYSVGGICAGGLNGEGEIIPGRFLPTPFFHWYILSITKGKSRAVINLSN